jgi:tetratricopeptide (TPR) repeat protein
MSAHWSRLESQSPEILDAARRTLRAQAEQELKTALDGFVNLRQHLAGRDEEQPLPADGQAILRNCMMAEADVLRDMNRFEEAASAYRAVELRYINEPPALEAIIGRASCARRLGRPQEANKLIRQARVVLQRIPSEWDGRFEQITRHDRAGWQALLAWMNQRIDSDGGV